MSDCQFCNEFKRGYIEAKGQNLNRTLFETDNFIVFPTLGQIVEGYLLIASKKHYISIGEVPKESYSELKTVQEKVRAVLSENYSTPLFFEHGPVSRTKKGGCCIEHAHIHAVPVQLNILGDLSKHFKYREIDSYGDLKRQFEKEIPYFFLEDNSGKKYLFDLPDVVPSQYIRKIIAQKIGKPDKWDWRYYLGITELIRTFEKLKDKFDPNR